MIRTVSDVLAALPEHTPTFDGSEHPLPLCEAILGRIPDAREIGDMVRACDPDDVGHLALHVGMAAECYEAGRPDADQRFVSDASLRGLVFRGGKWCAGWAFVLGDATEAFRSRLEEREFIVLPANGRPTEPVYWLQMMVRYAMTWGQIPPGQDHEMAHFLEEDLPGVLLVRGATSELESLLALAMMKLGCPAVVPDDFASEEGRQARVRDDDEALDAILTLPNLRVREEGGERIALPSYCDPAHAKEPFEAATTIGGEASFFALRPGDVEDGVDIVSRPDGSIGVLIEVGDRRLDVIISEYLERSAQQLPNYLPGIRVVSTQPFVLGLADGVELVPEKLAEVLQAGLKWHFPRLQNVHVNVIFDESTLAGQRSEVEEFVQERARAMAAETEETADDFVACIECQTFTHSHVCIVSPGRPPMCGRDPGQVRAAALFGATWHPYRRRGLKAEELREVIPKGRCLDAERGEYEGVNEAARRLSDGQIQRVFLHSLAGSPHSSCGCFHYLAFRITGCGIGVMHRSFEGIAPNGETWDSLANRAGGKQADGVTGLALGYLRSPEFLRADGGLGAVVWMTRRALDEIADLLPVGRTPATENDATTMEELRSFLGSRG